MLIQVQKLLIIRFGCSYTHLTLAESFAAGKQTGE